MKTSFKIISFLPLFALTAYVFVGQAYAEPYGWSPNVDNSWGGPPKCGDAKPDKAPILLQPNHPVLPIKAKKGEVVLYWHKVPGANGYNLYYGLSPKNYIYTAPNLGDTNNFTVRFLANKRYYFAVQAKNGCAASGLSNEWWGSPIGGGYSAPVLGTTTAYVPVKKQNTPVSQETGSTNVVNIPQVQGVATQVEEEAPVYQPPQQPQVQSAEQPVAAPVVPAAPKPKSFWEKILSFFFGR